MRVVFLGGTGFLGPPAVRFAAAAGHSVVVAHSGAHEVDDLPAEHLHGGRAELLEAGGPIDRARPDALVDTFAGGATRAKAEALAACARRCGARVVAIGSCDVYRALVEAGLGDGSGRSLLPRTPLPITEDAPVRTAPYPGARPGHDNASMEAALGAAGVPVAILRPGAIYGVGDRAAREWHLVRRLLAGERRLALPDRGVQLFHRVAVDRVARAIVASLERAPIGTHADPVCWTCNVVDPYDWTYAGLAGEVAELLGLEWEPEVVPFDEASHPFRLATPILMSDRRLVDVLGVTGPDPREALAQTVAWYRDSGPPEGARYADT